MSEHTQIISKKTSSAAANNIVIQRSLAIGAVNDPLEHEADAVADKVMRMTEHNLVQRKCAECEEEDKLQRKPLTSFIQKMGNDSGITASDSVSQKIISTKGSGSNLDSGTKSFMENRFGTDFSGVKIHTGDYAVQMSQELNAQAFTVGNDVYFNSGKYNPDSNSGKHLLAHELTHTVQQKDSIQRNIIQRYSGCTTAQDTIITDDHNRARDMLSNAITTVSSYNGTTPVKVYNALNTHFNGATSNAFASWINLNLRILWGLTWMAGYDCYANGIFERQWACRGSEYATTFWCVPLVNIRLCPAVYFAMTPVGRSTGLIHEWVHKYGCNLDYGYEHEEEYAQNSTITQLLNAESFSHFVRDVQ